MVDQCEAQVALVVATPLSPKQVFAVALGVDSASATYAPHTTVGALKLGSDQHKCVDQGIR